MKLWNEKSTANVSRALIAQTWPSSGHSHYHDKPAMRGSVSYSNEDNYPNWQFLEHQVLDHV